MSTSHAYQQSSPSIRDAPPSYTPTPDVQLNNKNFSSDPISPTGQIQQARFSQTNRSFVDDGGLPEVITPASQHKVEDVASEGLIPVVSPTIESPIDTTVTPLNLLGDQPDTVDCPFCQRRVETRVKKEPSYMTHVTATTLFLTTAVGAVAPYKYNWNSNVSHFCTNCGRKVAYRRYGRSKTKALGTPDHLKVASRFPAAGPAAPTGRQPY